MGAIAKLLHRFGFVKLERYGLLLTPEDRIMAIRPTILDDGVGGRVVGWQQHDLAFSELQAWIPGETNARREVVPPAPLVRALSRPAPPPAPKVQAAPVAKAPPPKPIPQPVVQVAPAVAPQPVVEEDEWEWEIAVARARAQALDEQAEAEQEEEDTWAVPTPVHGSQILAQESAPARAPLQAVPSAPRSTVIPVPALPMSDPSLVRASLTQQRTYSPPPRRFPRATEPPKKEWRATLPPAATTIGLPSARRVAAKTR